MERHSSTLWTTAVLVFTLGLNLALCQDDLVALESGQSLTMAEVPAAPRLHDGSLAPEHRAQSFPRYNVRRQFDSSPYTQGKDLPPPRNPMTPLQTMGQHFGEYMRRIGDYIYWFVSGNPPITRKRANGKLKHPAQSLFKRNFFTKKSPSRRKFPFRRQRPNKNFAKRTQQVTFLEHRPIDPKDFKEWQKN